jgi:hypothetical protein
MQRGPCRHSTGIESASTNVTAIETVTGTMTVDDHHGRHKKALSHRDWSFPVGGGSGGRISGPAKFVFDVTAAPSCTTDFVVTGIAANGAANQANVIGLNRLYTNPGGTGFCGGTGPLVMFAYNVGAGQVPKFGRPVTEWDENRLQREHCDCFQLPRAALRDGGRQRPLRHGTGGSRSR